MPWSSLATISPISNLQTLDVSDDGSFIALSYRSTNALRSTGRVVVYRWNGSNFIQRGSVLSSPSITEMGDETSGLTSTYGTEFGYDVQISNDGNMLIISEPNYNKYYNPTPPLGETGRFGRVLVYHYVDGEWTLAPGSYSRVYNVLLGSYDNAKFGKSIKLTENGSLCIRSNGVPTSSNNRYRGHIDILTKSIDGFFSYAGSGKIYNTAERSDPSNINKIYDMISGASDRNTFDVSENTLIIGCPNINVVKVYNIENITDPNDINTIIRTDTSEFGSKVRSQSDMIAISSKSDIFVYKRVNLNTVEAIYSQNIAGFFPQGSYNFDFDLIKIENRTVLVVSLYDIIEIVDVENNNVLARISKSEPDSNQISDDARIVFAKGTNASFFTNYNGSNWSTSNSVSLFQSTEVFPTATPTKTPTNTPSNSPTLSPNPTQTPTASSGQTPTPTPQATTTPTKTGTPTPTQTATVTATTTESPTPTPTETRCKDIVIGEGAQSVNEYDIQNTGSLEEANGGTALLSNGGQITSRGYEFLANQGLTVIDSLLDITRYSISIDFNIENTSYPIKVVDFKNALYNNGIYYLPTSQTTGKINLRFEPASNIISDVIVNTNTRNRLTLVRTLEINSTTGNVLSRTPMLKVLLNNVVLFEVEDNENFSIPDNNIFQLFIDDIFTSNESGSGVVYKITTYDLDVTSQECYLQSLPTPTPTVTSSATPTPTNTETPLPTVPLATQSLTPFPTASPTQTSTMGASQTPTKTLTATPTETPTNTPTPTQTLTPTFTPTQTVTKTRVSKFSKLMDCCVIDLSPTPTPSETPTNTPTISVTSTTTLTATPTTTKTLTATQTPTATTTKTLTATPTPTSTPVPFNVASTISVEEGYVFKDIDLDEDNQILYAFQDNPTNIDQGIVVAYNAVNGQKIEEYPINFDGLNIKYHSNANIVYIIGGSQSAYIDLTDSSVNSLSHPQGDTGKPIVEKGVDQFFYVADLGNNKIKVYNRETYVKTVTISSLKFIKSIKHHPSENVLYVTGGDADFAFMNNQQRLGLTVIKNLNTESYEEIFVKNVLEDIWSIQPDISMEIDKYERYLYLSVIHGQDAVSTGSTAIRQPVLFAFDITDDRLYLPNEVANTGFFPNSNRSDWRYATLRGYASGGFYGNYFKIIRNVEDVIYLIADHSVRRNEILAIYKNDGNRLPFNALNVSTGFPRMDVVISDSLIKTYNFDDKLISSESNKRMFFMKQDTIVAYYINNSQEIATTPTQTPTTTQTLTATPTTTPTLTATPTTTLTATTSPVPLGTETEFIIFVEDSSVPRFLCIELPDPPTETITADYRDDILYGYVETTNGVELLPAEYPVINIIDSDLTGLNQIEESNPYTITHDTVLLGDYLNPKARVKFNKWIRRIRTSPGQGGYIKFKLLHALDKFTFKPFIVNGVIEDGQILETNQYNQIIHYEINNSNAIHNPNNIQFTYFLPPKDYSYSNPKPFIKPHPLASSNARMVFGVLQDGWPVNGIFYYQNTGLKKIVKFPDVILDEQGNEKIFGDNSYVKFQYCNDLISVPSTLGRNVTDLSSMFYYCENINDKDIGNWDVSNITSMDRMFQGATSFNQSLEKWKPVSVTTTAYMFSGAKSFNNNIFTETPVLLNMDYMFAESSFNNSTISGLQTGSVVSMIGVFYKNSAFDIDLSDWNATNVTTTSKMFMEAVKFNSPIFSSTPLLSNASMMFSGAVKYNAGYAFETNPPYLYQFPKFNLTTSGVRDMSEMFKNAVNFQCDIGHWDVRELRYAGGMFRGAVSFTGVNINRWSTPNLTIADNMFSLTKLQSDLVNWDIFNLLRAKGFMNAVTLERSLYKNLLKSWSSKQRVQNVSIDFGNVKKDQDMLTDFRKLIYDTYWIIKDGDGVNADDI